MENDNEWVRNKAGRDAAYVLRDARRRGTAQPVDDLSPLLPSHAQRACAVQLVDGSTPVQSSFSKILAPVKQKQ